MTASALSMDEARSLLDAICLRIDGKPASAKTVNQTPFAEAASREWWVNGGDTRDVTKSSRILALLLGYVELGGELFPMTGIPLADGYLRPDRKVMRSLDQQHWIVMQDGAFHLTEEGRSALAKHRQQAPEVNAQKAGAERDGLAYGRAGEGDNHRRLRLWVQDNPGVLFPKIARPQCETEYLLPSADRIDVLCSTETQRIAIEVKSIDSNDADLARGIYQCVKYQAVLRAATQDGRVDVRAVLVTQRPLPQSLQDEARRLNIPTILVAPDRKM